MPRTYLARFGHNGRVLVRWRDKAGVISVGVQNIAVECRLYEIEGPTGAKSVAVEETLVIRAMPGHRPPSRQIWRDEGVSQATYVRGHTAR